jgi:hypothetical protein
MIFFFHNLRMTEKLINFPEFLSTKNWVKILYILIKRYTYLTSWLQIVHKLFSSRLDKFILVSFPQSQSYLIFTHICQCRFILTKCECCTARIQKYCSLALISAYFWIFHVISKFYFLGFLVDLFLLLFLFYRSSLCLNFILNFFLDFLFLFWCGVYSFLFSRSLSWCCCCWFSTMSSRIRQVNCMIRRFRWGWLSFWGMGCDRDCCWSMPWNSGCCWSMCCNRDCFWNWRMSFSSCGRCWCGCLFHL